VNAPRTIAVALLAVGLALAAAGSGRPPTADAAGTVPAEASAWLVRVETPHGLSLRLGDTAARAGDAPAADATPAALGDAAPVRAVADPARPDAKVTATPLQWTDPSGSMTMEGAFAEAQAAPTGATARAGFGTASGTGYPVANALFSWEQQEHLLGEVQALDDAVFVPLNARMAALAPVLGAAGLAVPRFEGVTPLGLVDVGRQRMAAASAEAAAADGFASSRAEATLDGVRLLGGFVDARALSAEAVSEGDAEAPERQARTWIGALTVAGVPVVAEGGRLRAAGNDVVSRTVVQPALDLLIDALRRQGVELRVGDARGDATSRAVAALEVRIATAGGAWTISVVQARAAAAGVGATSPASDAVPAPSPTAIPAPPAGSAAGRDGLATPVPPAADTGPEPAADAAATAFGAGTGGDRWDEASPATQQAVVPPSGGAVVRPVGGRRFPAAVSRSVQAVYLLLVVAGVGGALVLPALVAPAPRSTRRRTAR
jgi:hypothetical protein